MTGTRVAVLTVSDASAAGTHEDRSGPAIVAWARARGSTVAAHEVVPDEQVTIVRRLLAWCDGDVADVVLTTGGTGLASRDVTPEATRAVVERDAPGIAELLRARGLASTPRAALSRGLAGVRARTLIVNLPGSPAAVDDALLALDPILEHAVAVLRDEPTDHARTEQVPRSSKLGEKQVPRSARDDMEKQVPRSARDDMEEQVPPSGRDDME